MKVGILQLSDLHFENKDYTQKIDAIYNACEYDLKESKWLFITIVGDVVNQGRNEGYEKAKELIVYLQEKIKSKISLLTVKSLSKFFSAIVL